MGTEAEGAGSARPSKALIAVGFLRLLKERSLCQRLQVSALVCDPGFRTVYAMGYNGPAAGEPHDLCRKTEPGNCGCVHAEANALVKLRTSETGLYLFCTNLPCEVCARLIVNCGAISQVLFLDDYRSTLGLEVFKRSKIKVCRLSHDDKYSAFRGFQHVFTELVIEEIE